MPTIRVLQCVAISSKEGSLDLAHFRKLKYAEEEFIALSINVPPHTYVFGDIIRITIEEENAPE